jgi:hypothetical protein
MSQVDVLSKEFASRKDEIQNELEVLFKANMKITDWDVPEANDHAAAKILLEILQDKLDSISADIQSGKYNNY